MGLFGSGFADKLGNLGTGLMAAQASIDGDFGTSAGLLGGMAKQRETALKEQQAAEARRQRIAALVAKGLPAETAAILAADDTALRQTLMPEKATPYRFEDNAGNVWERDQATGENRRIFTDQAERTLMGPDNQLITIKNPWLENNAPPPRAPVGNLTPLGGASTPAAPPFPPRLPLGGSFPRRR